MSLLWSLLLGLVQGATEFLPVSSSAHLAFVGALAGIKEEDALPYFLVLHLGTLLALGVFFARDLARLGSSAARMEKDGLKLLMMIAVTSVPTAVIGLLLKRTVERAMVSPAWPAAFLLATAALLLSVPLFRKSSVTMSSLTLGAALVIGAAQGLAALPGVSRSGSTIVAALACGLLREEAFDYSFLASIPAICGACLLDLKEIMEVGARFGAASLLLGFASSFAAGYVSLLLLKKVVVRGKLHYFGYYCVFASACGFLLAFSPK